MTRERRICTTCHGDRCVTDGASVQLCPTCHGDGVELLELAEPLRPRPPRQLVMWYQLELELGGES